MVVGVGMGVGMGMGMGMRGGWVPVVAAATDGAGAVNVVVGAAGAGTWAAVWRCGRGNGESGFGGCGHFDETFGGDSGRHDAATFSGVLGWLVVWGG